jgi:hypothetical protein
MKQLFALLFVLTSCHVFSQSFYVPDDNFEQGLIDLGYDDVLDDSVLYDNIDTVTFLILSDREIESFEGIAAFTELITFSCEFNNLEAIDVSSNLFLRNFYCGMNEITELDLSANINLEIMHCSENELGELELSNNLDLRILHCSYNLFTELDLTVNVLMEQLIVSHTNLTSLDVSTLTELNHLTCRVNELEELDLSNNSNLYVLDCIGNELDELDVSNCPQLDYLDCSYNPFTLLDVSTNLELQIFYCSHSSIVDLNLDNNINLERVYITDGLLETLSIRNGNNTEIAFALDFDLHNNPHIKCVSVDDPAYSEATWTWVDDILNFSLDCESLSTEEERQLELNVYPNPTSEFLSLDVNLDAYSMNLYSIDGALLMTANLNAGKNKIDLNGLAKGVYLIEVLVEDKVYSERIIVQ